MFIFSLSKFKKNLLSKKERIQVKSIPVNMIISGKYKIRDYKIDKKIDFLSRNIKDYGVLQPILVKKLENDMFEIVSGHRRFLAAKKANIKKIPVIIIDIGVCDKKLPVYLLSENLHRSDLNFFEEAEALFKLIDEYNFTQEMISSSLGIDQSFITDRLKLLKINKIVRDKIILFDINIKIASLIAMLEKEADQLIMIEKIIKNNLNFEQAKNMIENYIKKDLNLLDYKNYKETKSETIYIVKDVRLFDNTISQAINLMKKSGLEASFVKSENSQSIEYVIKIPKDKIYIKKSS